VPKGRQTWCSEKCVEDYRIRAWPGYARKKVWERDGGLCERCGQSVKVLAHALNRRVRRRYQVYEEAVAFLVRVGVTQSRLTRQYLYRLVRTSWGERREPYYGLPGVVAEKLWEMDHRVPVSEGGGGCGLDNLRTLCLWCHRKETRALRKRLKEKRDGRRELPRC